MEQICHEPCCGHCMYCLPNKQVDYGCNQPKAITKGKGKGQRSYWLCKCKDSEHFGMGRIADDGTDCKYFEDKYKSDEMTEEWVAKCYEERMLEKKRRKPKKWTKFV